MTTPHRDTIRAALIEARHAKRDPALYTDAEWLARQARIEAALVALQEATEPQPDWSQAPAWARWWAVAADGCVGWCSTEPQLLAAFGEWAMPLSTEVRHDEMIDIPLGVDWRLLKQQRPQKGGADAT